MSDEERDQAGIGSLPENLIEAIRALEESELVREALGEPVYNWYVRNKKLEWNAYRTRVTQWELEEYLPVL